MWQSVLLSPAEINGNCLLRREREDKFILIGAFCDGSVEGNIQHWTELKIPVSAKHAQSPKCNKMLQTGPLRRQMGSWKMTQTNAAAIPRQSPCKVVVNKKWTILRLCIIDWGYTLYMRKQQGLKEQGRSRTHWKSTPPPPSRGGRVSLRGQVDMSHRFMSRSQVDPLDSVSLATQVSQVKRLISQNCRVQSSAPPLPPSLPPSLCSRRRREPTLRCNSSGGQIENKFRSNFHTMARRLLLIWPKTAAAQSRDQSTPLILLCFLYLLTVAQVCLPHFHRIPAPLLSTC